VTYYRVSFFRKKEDGKELLGSVVIDNYMVDDKFTITAKAFRQASSNCLMADTTMVEEVRHAQEN
jgi:hypothetical protein